MSRSTAIMNLFGEDTQEGTSLHFERCKGGYFSNIDEYGLKVVGKTAQVGTPSPDSPQEIQCVKAGTKVICDECEITTPCDLYEGDIWYPMSGKVVRKWDKYIFDGVTVGKRFNAGWGNDIDANLNVNGILNMKFALPGEGIGYCNYSPCVNALSKSGIVFGWNNATGLYLTHLEAFGFEGYTDINEFIAEKYSTENPFYIIYELAEPIIEQYAVQPISAPSGTVNVIQEPIQLTADLEATMLVRR